MVEMKLTYRKKVRLLPWIAAGTFILVYWLSLSETIGLRNEVKEMEQEVLTAGNTPKLLHQLKARLEEIDEISGNKMKEMVSDPLLELSSKQASDNQAILSEYQPVHIYNYGNHQVETRIISFEAPFIPCLKVLYNIEKAFRYGKVVSVNYSTRTDYRTSKKHLTMQVLIQTIQNESTVAKISE